tara:strand:- start:86 stop:1252 length:1167 start_codon:yes stop_codon:yes gene_type:complete
MKKIFSTKYKYGNKILYLSILICFSLIAFYNIKIGFIMSPDSSTFSRWADDLIKLNFNFYEYYDQNTYIRSNIFYTIPVLLIAVLKLTFETGWQNSFMFLNLIFVLFSFIIFSRILKLLKVRPLIISLSIPLLSLSADLLTWPRYILSDTFFSFLIILTFYFMIRGIVNEKLYYIVLSFLIFIMFLTRPTSIPYIFIFIIFLSFSNIKFNFNPKIILLFILLLSLITPVILTLFYQLTKIYFINNSQLLTFINWVDAGMIIHDRPETWVNPPNTFIDIVYIYFKRYLFFFNPYISAFSLIHIVLNLLQTLVIFLSLIFWFFFSETYRAINKSVLLILLVCFSVAIFHSFTLIDYDWRYRFPIILPLTIIFPISLEIVTKRLIPDFSRF